MESRYRCTCWTMARKVNKTINKNFLHPTKRCLLFFYHLCIIQRREKYDFKNIFDIFLRIFRLRNRSGTFLESETWINCTMLVHDLVQRDVNIAADISEFEVEQFQEMCQNFAMNLK